MPVPLKLTVLFCRINKLLINTNISNSTITDQIKMTVLFLYVQIWPILSKAIYTSGTMFVIIQNLMMQH